ncbi:hypothetical protein QF035_001632 [Streptomyces umbrinus]|uniref:Uncharacterized protein n=1 Tax=Streptomyces umbrinus TaxID=67370 RepID=A0ABU0SKF8_9ACTN|nr:hypothetical protein [Streptomyces umbrinus]
MPNPGGVRGSRATRDPGSSPGSLPGPLIHSLPLPGSLPATSLDSYPAASSNAVTLSRARATRDRTVPTGQPTADAASA